MALDSSIVPLVASNFDLLCDVKFFFILGVFHSNVGDCEFVGEVCPTL